MPFAFLLGTQGQAAPDSRFEAAKPLSRAFNQRLTNRHVPESLQVILFLDA
jgi:hypothetical protein